MGIYTLIDSFNNKELFRNIVIVLVFLFFFLKLSVGLNIILALALAVICILYLTEKETQADQVEHEQYKRKLETIKPAPIKITEDKDMIDFLFSIQDFYVFNPQSYEEVIDNLNAFKSLHENIFGDEELCNYYYQIADSKKNNALNSFHSLIFSLPNNKTFTEKFDRAHKRLETILNKHMNEIYDQCNYNLYKDGRDVLKRQINKGPKEYNHYFDKDFTYQFY